MQGTLSVYLLLAFLKFIVAQRNPTISHISPELIKDIGDTVNLQCSVQNAQDYPVRWIKVDENPLLLSSGPSMLIPDNRYSVRYDAETSTYTLQIKDIQQTDAGSYQCSIFLSKTTRISADVELRFRSPPVISDYSTRSVITREGLSVKLQCSATGFPVPTISWRRQNNEILPTGDLIYHGNTLELSPVEKDHRGIYYCIAENGVGRRARRVITVKVQFAPVISSPRPRLGQALQYDMDLECQVEAYPPPAITWTKDEVKLQNNLHYAISQFATVDEFVDSIIRAITIEPWQYGQYVCQAANELGTAETTIELFETTTPICPPACGVKINGTTETPPSSPTPELSSPTPEFSSPTPELSSPIPELSSPTPELSSPLPSLNLTSSE